MGTKVANIEVDLAIARLAAHHHGVVSTTQLRLAGLTSRAIHVRVQAGRLHRIHRGVYAVGHTHLSNEGRWMAAVFACGEGAVLSHRSAAMHWGILRARDGLIDVTVPTAGGRARRRGIRLHRSTSLTRQAVTIRQGIPTTTPERTIADLRRLLSSHVLEAVIAQAEVKRLPIGRHRGFLHEPTRSELERRFIRLCRRHHLPQPEVNTHIGPYEPDFLWRDRQVIVETDGWEAHGTPSAFEADRARDVRLGEMGYRVLRFTYRQVWDDGVNVARSLRPFLT